MLLVHDNNLGKFVLSPGNSLEPASPEFHRGDTPEIALQLCRSGTVVEVGDHLQKSIIGISIAAAAVVTFASAHGFSNGATVRITGSNCTPTIDGDRVITVLSSTTFSVAVTTTTAGSAGKVMLQPTWKCGIKPQGQFDGDYLVYSATETFTGTTTTAKYSFAPSFDTVELNAALNKDGSTANDKPSILANLEFQVVIGTYVQTFGPIVATILNDVNRGDEGGPNTATTPYPVPGNLVTLDAEQTITGVKNFTAGLSVGGGADVLKILSGTASLNFPSIAAADEEVLTITVTGAVVGDVVAGLGWSAALEDGLVVAQVWVSAADTVSVRLFNGTGLSIDPATIDCRAVVFHF